MEDAGSCKASRGLFSMLRVERGLLPGGGAQSVLTCVTWASAVWLVDWMNIVWVSSCPAGIVTGWIWYNCCKIKRRWWTEIRIWTMGSCVQHWFVNGLYSILVPSHKKDKVTTSYLSICELVELLLSLLYLCLCDLRRIWFEHCK